MGGSPFGLGGARRRDRGRRGGEGGESADDGWRREVKKERRRVQEPSDRSMHFKSVRLELVPPWGDSHAKAKARPPLSLSPLQKPLILEMATYFETLSKVRTARLPSSVPS